MRILSRNKQDLWFANRQAETYVVDANGLKTGEKTQSYSNPVKTRMSVDGAEGTVVIDSYGINVAVAYTHKAVTEDKSCAMNEESIVWFGIEPTTVINGKTVAVPHNFTVVRKTKCLNHLLYFLKEVDVK